MGNNGAIAAIDILSALHPLDYRMSDALDFLLELFSSLLWDNKPTRAHVIVRIAVVVAILIVIALVVYGLST